MIKTCLQFWALAAGFSIFMGLVVFSARVGWGQNKRTTSEKRKRRRRKKGREKKEEEGRRERTKERDSFLERQCQRVAAQKYQAKLEGAGWGKKEKRGEMVQQLEEKYI